MRNSEYLYQYTSLETLAIILKEKKIKFSKLNSLDDPLEKYIGFICIPNSRFHITNNVGDFCFVSCWSKNKNESIAMWDMYGDRKKGVRIGLPADMLDPNYIINDNKKMCQHRLFECEEPIKKPPELIKISYNRTSDPVIIDKDLNLDLDSLGRYKIKDWEFQEEYRFRIFAEYDERIKANSYLFSSELTYNNFSFEKPISESYLLYGIKSSVMSKIKIIIGPDMPKGKRYLLESLIKDYEIDRRRVRNSKFTDPLFVL
ncbi:Protein of unknown function (DUF2971) [Ruminococcaceae bacterium R-25]|nr:Protein of unknown function (DUF2971) [Ruminococcaceae bacterium R-25]SUQ11313.1 Protein of unknown function [Oscillospiraceae bacterium]